MALPANTPTGRKRTLSAHTPKVAARCCAATTLTLALLTGCTPTAAQNEPTGSGSESPNMSEPTGSGSEGLGSEGSGPEGTTEPTDSKQSAQGGADWDDDLFVAGNGAESPTSPSTPFPTRTAQTINPDTGQIQENSLMKWDEWPDNAHLKAALFKATPSTAMRKTYGAAADVAAYDAALVVAIAQVGLTGLYGPRDGDEGSYYKPIRRYMTDELWEALQTHIQQGVSGQSFYIGSFAPQTDRDGIWTTIKGVPYVSLGSSSVTFTGIPRFSMQDDLVGVAFEIEVTGHARPHDIQYDALYTAIMRLDGDQWKLNGWNNLVTSEIRIVDAPTVIGN